MVTDTSGQDMPGSTAEGLGRDAMDQPLQAIRALPDIRRRAASGERLDVASGLLAAASMEVEASTAEAAASMAEAEVPTADI